MSQFKRGRWMAVAFLATTISLPLSTNAQESDADRRARETEARMTDAERFSMLYSLMPIKFGTTMRAPRVPADTPPVGGYVQGVPRRAYRLSGDCMRLAQSPRVLSSPAASF